MGKIFTYTEKGKTLKFEEDKEYFIVDWFPIERSQENKASGPLVIKAICTFQSYEDEGVDFYLRTIEHLIPSVLPLGRYEHPNSISVDDWDTYFFDSYEKAIERLYKEYKWDEAAFFQKLFGDWQR